MRIKKNRAAVTAAVTATALVGLAAAPAGAAPEDPAPAGTSKGTASALQLALGGQDPQGTGVVVATNDGSGQQKTGRVNPPISVLSGQDLLDAGVLSQDAAARDNGTAEACSGVAGEGGSVAQIGSSDCITPGQPVGLTIANLDLTGLQLAEPGTALEPINQIGDPLLKQLVPALNQIVDPLEENLGGMTGITGTFDVLASRCEATSDSATGDATITNPSLDATFMEQSFDLVELPANPPPNTEVPVELDVVVNTILDAVKTQLTEGIDGAGAPLATLPEQVKKQIVANLVAPVAEQLQPLQDNVIKLVLNQQNRPADDRIEVTALSLDVLPAAEEFADGPLLEGDIASVTCDGANVAPEPEPEPSPEPQPSPEPEPEQDQPVPTTITSGTDGGAQGEARATDDIELTAATGAGAAAVALAALVSGGLLLRRRTHR